MNRIILAAAISLSISLTSLEAGGSVHTIGFGLTGVSQTDGLDTSRVDLNLSGPTITADMGDPLDIVAGDTVTVSISAAAGVTWSVGWVATLDFIRAFEFEFSIGTPPGAPGDPVIYTGGGFSGGGPVAGPVFGFGEATTDHFEFLSILDPPLDPSANFDFTTFSMSFIMPVTADYTSLPVTTASARFRSLAVNNPEEEDMFPDWVTSSSSNVVPEPCTIAIWSVLGLVGAGVHWRRRRKAA